MAKKILIAEDEFDIRFMLEQLLRLEGFEVLGVPDGRKAVEALAQQDFDLLMLDITMPELDGFGVLEGLKEDGRLQDVPVIVITAKDLTATEKQRLSGRVKGLLQKGTFLSTDLLDDVIKTIE